MQLYHLYPTKIIDDVFLNEYNKFNIKVVGTN